LLLQVVIEIAAVVCVHMLQFLAALVSDIAQQQVLFWDPQQIEIACWIQLWL